MKSCSGITEEVAHRVRLLVLQYPCHTLMLVQQRVVAAYVSTMTYS